MAEHTESVYQLPDRQFWERTYAEFNSRRKGTYYSLQQVTEELRNYASINDKSKPIRILDIGGADGDLLCKALANVPELKVDLVCVVEPSKKYVDLYGNNIAAMNTIGERNVVLKAVVEGYELRKLQMFHDDHCMDYHYDVILLINVLSYSGLQSVPELRDHFLKPKSGHLIIICTSPICMSRKFADAHYERFCPSMIPSKRERNVVDSELMHFAINDNNSCFMKSYHDMFEVSDIVSGDDTASGNEKGREFLRFLMQRDLDADTAAGILELRVYVQWVKRHAIRAYPYLEHEAERESLTTFMKDKGVTLDRYLLPSPTNLYRLTSDSMVKTLTVASAQQANVRWNQRTEIE